MSKNPVVSVQELCELAGVSVKELQYYEKEKIISPASVKNGESYYYFHDACFLTHIALFVNCGVPIEKIHEFIRARNAGGEDKTEVMNMLNQFRDIMEDKKERLEKFGKYVGERMEQVESAVSAGRDTEELMNDTLLTMFEMEPEIVKVVFESAAAKQDGNKADNDTQGDETT